MTGKKVVVVGGGAVGLDVVEFFAPRGADDNHHRNDAGYRKRTGCSLLQSEHERTAWKNIM